MYDQYCMECVVCTCIGVCTFSACVFVYNNNYYVSACLCACIEYVYVGISVWYIMRLMYVSPHMSALAILPSLVLSTRVSAVLQHARDECLCASVCNCHFERVLVYV